ncbi:MAG: hypothetical protein JW804_02675 [Sedimentisphaerales bacterium]|nr:hypothetical protein [Sedimentisphaerales bacterium]
MYYTIDLLKGQGIPAKSRPEGIVAMVITAAVPFVIALSMIGIYLSAKVIIGIHKSEIANYERKIEEFSDRMITYKNKCQQKAELQRYLSETSEVIDKHNQWSVILVTIVENMPDSLVLNRLSVNENKVRVTVPDKKNPDKKKQLMVPSRTLSMILQGSSSAETDRAVKEFRKRLQLSSVLGPKVEDIPVSQKVDEENNQKIISYEMKCIFKPQI